MEQKRKQITVEDVTEFVMEPGSDSEMSELMDSHDDEEYIPDERIANNDVELVSDEEMRQKLMKCQITNKGKKLLTRIQKQ